MAPRTQRRLVRSIVRLSPLLLGALACTPVPSTPDSSESEDPTGPQEILARTVPDSAGTLVFPPSYAGRRERPALDIAETDETDPNTGFRVQSPHIEEGGDSFEVEGQTVRVVFNRPVKLPRPIKSGKTVPAAAGTLTIAPEVAGKAVWTSNNAIEFTAKKPFDPEQTYTITIAGVSTTDDVALAEPWTAKFTAEPRIEIAGKTITYLPTPGEPKVVEVFPSSGAKIGTNDVIQVVFDQPLTPKQAAEMITVNLDGKDDKKKGDSETEIKVKLANARSNRIEGHTLSPRQVIEIRGAEPFGADQDIAVQLEDMTYRYSIAGELTVTKVGCGYSYDRSVCEWSEPKLRTDGREVVVEYTNPLAASDAQLKSTVRVSPMVANMNVYTGGSWDSTGRVSI
jgi:hypothetical protein